MRVDGGSKGGKNDKPIIFYKSVCDEKGWYSKKKTPFSLKKKSSSKSSFAPPYNTNKFNFK